MKLNRKRLKNESGVALIPVLCLIFTCSLLVMMALIYSQKNIFIINPHTELQKSFYRTEGVANRVYWLVLMSGSKVGNNNPGLLNYDYTDAEETYFFPDGKSHPLDYYGYPMEFTLYA